MTGTMTSAGLDVHARSIDAAAVCVATGELTRRRFGAAPGPVVGWLKALPGPVHACYEAGPTGFGLQRAAVAAGVRVDVVAPSKTPRAAGDRVKTDRKDAELLARLLLAGQLTAVRVPDARMEARRELFRCHEQARGDLQRARHRTSKMLLRHGRVWSEGSAWTQRHRAWLARQQFDQRPRPVPADPLLLPALRRGAPSRVINVSAGGMYTQRLCAQDLQLERREYDPPAFYAHTKRCEVILTDLWAERLRDIGIGVHAMHPGWADTPGVQTSLPRFRKLMRPLLRSADQAADTIVWLATAAEPAERPGLFWHDRAPRPTHRVPWTRESEADCERLWDACARLSGSSGDAGTVPATASVGKESD